MRINIHAGHNPDGKVACGAIGLIKESTEARIVVTEMIRLFKADRDSHTIYNCTVDDGTSSGNVLTKIVGKCNTNSVDLDVSIHFNAGVNDRNGNGVTTGVETLLYSSSSKGAPYATRVNANIAKLGYRNRGNKYRTDLYFLKNTKAPAILVECCFVDDKDDVDKYNYKTMAKAIVEGILGRAVIEAATTTPITSTTQTTLWGVKVHSFGTRERAIEFQQELKARGYYSEVYNVN